MPHLINTIYDASISSAITSLEEAHTLIVERVIAAQKVINVDSLAWGEQFKRLEVSLPQGAGLIGKHKEKFVEIINILATVERTISALKWLSTEYPKSIVRECHPSTSDNKGGNDIVLTDQNGKVIVRCEVTDVSSSSAGQNGKEKKDLKNLQCSIAIPNDSVYRYIATSLEFADALSSPKRKWRNMHYKYLRHETGLNNSTILLEIKNKT